MRYLPHTEEEIREMLEVAGFRDLDALFETIPQAARLGRALDVPPALGESSLMRHMSQLAEQNSAAGMLSFLGCGAYAHHIPPAVDQLLLRSEFYTAYTPYQPEVAQGTLQAIWEFQTLTSELFGLPLANASLYDGASATAEAVLMASRITKRSAVVLSECVHPHYRQTTASYLAGNAEPAVTVPADARGAAHVEALLEAVDDRTACVVVGYPSYLGPLSDLSTLAEACHKRGALLVATVVEPYALALAAPPGDWGADIAVGEGQPLACAPQFGGPGVGLFACRDDRTYLKQLPGRVCGKTVDAHGKPGYVLTLSTREQHIRRERATSNICTNQGLVALSMTIRMALLGKSGFVQVGEQCLAKTQYLRAKLATIPGCALVDQGAPVFNEFALQLPEKIRTKTFLSRMEARKILAGVDVGRFNEARDGQLLVAVTEEHTREDLDRLVSAWQSALTSAD